MQRINYIQLFETYANANKPIRHFCLQIYNRLSLNIYNKLQYNTILNIISRILKYPDWVQLIRYYKISEDFIKEFIDGVDWTYVFDYQNVSSKFRKKYKNKLRDYG